MPCFESAVRARSFRLAKMGEARSKAMLRPGNDKDANNAYMDRAWSDQIHQDPAHRLVRNLLLTGRHEEFGRPDTRSGEGLFAVSTACGKGCD